MNIQQLEYIIAVDNHRHFAKAAEASFVTQPTLSMMIQKLEDELNIRIFDRSKHPVEPTMIGQQVIEQARISLRHFNEIRELVETEQNVVTGTFHLGIIPTIAPYLVPALLQQSSKSFDLILKESTTDKMIEQIMKGTLDGGILASPLENAELREYPVYYEKFYAYVSPLDPLHGEKEVDLDTLDVNRVWLLENEHCLRGQIERLCRAKKEAIGESTVRYESGSIDTLINVVDNNPGITIIPEMHAMGLTEDQQDNLRPFKGLTAVREVSLVVGKEYVRRTMVNAVLAIIRQSVPKSMQDPALKEFIVPL